MGKSRLEAFSDGVIAIIITIMVLELKAPHEATLDALRPLVPVLLSYALSFLYVGIYWNNHHHLLHAAHKVSGGILWANLHLLFWLSLIPFTTAWMDESQYAAVPTALYGVVLLMAGIAYWILQHLIILSQGSDSILKKAVGRDWKGKLSPVAYLSAILIAPWSPKLALAMYVGGALAWFIPDRRIEHALHGQESDSPGTG
ncbi:MAG: TMEM175 family protein [Steroidobacteraceae bacterium]